MVYTHQEKAGIIAQYRQGRSANDLGSVHISGIVI